MNCWSLEEYLSALALLLHLFFWPLSETRSGQERPFIWSISSYIFSDKILWTAQASCWLCNVFVSQGMRIPFVSTQEVMHAAWPHLHGGIMWWGFTFLQSPVLRCEAPADPFPTGFLGTQNPMVTHFSWCQRTICVRHQPCLTHGRHGSREKPWWCYPYHTCCSKGSRGGSWMSGSSAFGVREQVSNEHRGNWCSWDMCLHVPRVSLFWSLCEIVLFWKKVDILQPCLSFPTKNEAVRSRPGFFFVCLQLQTLGFTFANIRKKSSDSEVKNWFISWLHSPDLGWAYGDEYTYEEH